MRDWDDEVYFTKYDIYRDDKRGLECEETYDDLDIVYQSDEIPEDGEIDLEEVME